MEIELLHYTPLWVCSRAIRTCWNSHDKSDSEYIKEKIDTNSQNIECQTTFKFGEKDRELIDRVGNKNKHSSTLEHLVYTFDINGISRACLQELARHRIASYSVKSTRYTLKELKIEEPFISNGSNEYPSSNQLERANKYIILTENKDVDSASVHALERLRVILKQGISNDVAKYSLPESYKVSLVMTINCRSLQNFLFLRSSKAALQEIRNLANNIYNQLPEDHKYLFEEYICKKV